MSRSYTDKLRTLIADSLTIDEDDIVAWVAENFSPSYVYTNGELEDWARDHNYKKEVEHAS